MRALTIVVLLLLVLGGALGAFFHFIDAEVADEHRKAQAWQQFSMEHHCTVSHPSSFLEAATTWECVTPDGKHFQVIRTPND